MTLFFSWPIARFVPNSSHSSTMYAPTDGLLFSFLASFTSLADGIRSQPTTPYEPPAAVAELPSDFLFASIGLRRQLFGIFTFFLHVPSFFGRCSIILDPLSPLPDYYPPPQFFSRSFFSLGFLVAVLSVFFSFTYV